MSLKTAAVLAATALAVAAGGCGFGAGESAEGEVTMRVTEDFGEELLLAESLEDPAETDTVIGFLDRVAEIETSFGGNFVDSIDGREGTTTGGGDHDWLYFVNGVWADVGGGERSLVPGDRIWWDYRYWYEAERVPVVVGSWPEPFKSGYDGTRYDVVLHCLGVEQACETVRGELDSRGIDYSDATGGLEQGADELMRILVGPWGSMAEDEAAGQLEGGPAESGVYASMVSCADGGAELVVRGADGVPRQILHDAGLLAAVRAGTDQPTLLVSGTDSDHVSDAAEMLDPEDLLDRYAVATVGGHPIPIPAPAAVPALEGGEERACG